MLPQGLRLVSHRTCTSRPLVSATATLSKAMDSLKLMYACWEQLKGTVAQVIAGSVRQVRPHSQRLYVDWLAVATGLRPAAMLEYVPACATTTVVHHCNGVCAHGDGAAVVVVLWGSCPWLVNMDVAVSHLQAACSDRPSDSAQAWLVTFSDPPGSQPCNAVTVCQNQVCPV
jgi:hypothetical protein